VVIGQGVVAGVGTVEVATVSAACWLKSPSSRSEIPPTDQIRVCPDRCDESVCALPARST